MARIEPAIFYVTHRSTAVFELSEIDIHNLITVPCAKINHTSCSHISFAPFIIHAYGSQTTSATHSFSRSKMRGIGIYVVTPIPYDRSCIKYFPTSVRNGTQIQWNGAARFKWTYISRCYTPTEKTLLWTPGGTRILSVSIHLQICFCYLSLIGKDPFM